MIVPVFLIAIIATAYYFWFVRNPEISKEKKRLLHLIDKKQCERLDSFQKLKSQYKLNPDRNKIVSLDFEELSSQLQNRNISAVQALEAYIAKALEVTDEFNCVTEFVPDAKKYAEELDSLSKPKGPLHGIPFAVKDDHDIKGMDTTMGFAKNLFKPAADTAVIVKVLVDLGAIPFCKTNVPQTMSSIATDNPIFGKTLNAINKKLSPGGSSGGSGCIVAAGGALLAIGSDIAGSLRIPAHNHGIATLRSTTTRLSDKGIASCAPKLLGVSGVSGILTKDVKTLAKVYKLITDKKRQYAYDALAAPLVWDEESFSSKQKLKIGYYTSIPEFPAMGDTPTTVLKAKNCLETLGHKTVEFPMPDAFNLMKDINDVFYAANVNHIYNHFTVEPVSKAILAYVIMVRLPNFVRKCLAYIFSHSWIKLIYSPRIAGHFTMGLDAVKTEDFVESAYRIRQVQKKVLKTMEELDIDLLLGPTFPFPAVGVDDAPQLSAAVNYTFIWNFLNFPAGVMKFGTESGQNIDDYDDEGDLYLKMAKKMFQNCKGMPIGVQVIGKPFNEETILRVISDLENHYQD